jgi:hypothetical protein
MLSSQEYDKFEKGLRASALKNTIIDKRIDTARQIDMILSMDHQQFAALTKDQAGSKYVH